MLEKLQKISNNANSYSERLVSEEITKTALILPFIQILGYDTSNPFEVVPEYHSDFADIKADKADICIIIDNKPSIIIEAKKYGTKLDSKCRRQLAQYFHWIKTVSLAILTDGVSYEFFSDLENKNQMDENPFYTLNIHQLNQENIRILELISKEKYNTGILLEFANTLNTTNVLFEQIRENFSNPGEEYIKFILQQVKESLPNKQINNKVLLQYQPNIIEAHKQLINNEIKKRLGVPDNQIINVLNNEIRDKTSNENITNEEKPINESYILGFEIIRAISCELIDIDRLFIRNTESYCNILIDNNKLKTVARMMFNNPNKLRINIFDDRNEILELEKLSDIYKYIEKIKISISNFI